MLESRRGRIWCAALRSLFEWSAASGFRRRQFPLHPQDEISQIVEDPRGGLRVGTSAQSRKP
jgi:hypothetical protein